MAATLLSLALLSTAVVAETIHGVVVFTRHGDRTTRMFPGYYLTNLGAQQAYSSGQYYRQRYIADNAASKIANISSDVDAKQIWASAPNQGLLFQTANNFLQGLYPPASVPETLANGTEVEDPLNGYQFILINGQSTTSEDTIWIKGDDNCPVHIASQKSYLKTAAFNATLDSTKDIYAKYDSLLEPILGDGEVTYENAYEIFDLLNVAKIHNSSVANQINQDDLDQIRYLADQWEWNSNFNTSQSQRSIGGQTMLGGILRRMNETVAKSAKSNKFQLFSGSYDTFMSIFGLTNLTAANPNFYGLPDYASTMAFEMFTESGSASSPAAFPATNAVNETLRVRFLFRNGTTSSSQLDTFPLFGGSDTSMAYGDFVNKVHDLAINSDAQWCTTCGSLQDFCVAANQTSDSTASSDSSATSSTSDSVSGLSNAAAGGIGAAVTLVVIGLFAALAWVLVRRRKASHPGLMREKSVRSEGSSDAVTP